MDKKKMKDLKINRITFLVGGILFFIIGIPAPFLWVFSVVLFLLAYVANKEYKRLVSEAEKKKAEEKPITKQPIADDKVKVIDLDGNTLMISPSMQIDGTEDVLISDGGRTFHTSVGCFKKWKPEMREGFTGWKIIKRSEALKMGMKYCAFCDEASNLTIDDLEDSE